MNNQQQQHKKTMDRVQKGLDRRYRQERHFKWLGLGAIMLGLVFVSFLFITIISNGYTAFQQTYVKLDVFYDPEMIAPIGETDPELLSRANYGGLIKASMRQMFPDVTNRREKKVLYGLISSGATYEIRDAVMNNPELIGTKQEVWVVADDDFDMLIKGHIDLRLPESDRRIKDNQLAWIHDLQEQDRVEKRFNTTFFTAGDSREPELSGIKGAAYGSFFTLLICLTLAFPVGVAAAVYLEEFAPKNRWTDIIEVNINNLAAVPSIVFGLLGLAVFINFFGLPRSVPLVGGLVLALMTLPTIIIASRAALKSVPPSIREAALGVGASPMQTITHHVVPLALPGMLTGTIIGMAQALGETAPLLMIGMVAFIVDVPGSVMDPSAVLPVQIYLWADSPERAFVERTSAAIMILLAFLISMNLLAVWLRKKFERRW
ncbi:phosphate ABC transporter permease PstA [Candidatus Thiodiazotropha endoloripes]|uniref:Phosphate transport system permease protein PstA n=1 Tax=Candidatus Thiodiazotropha endoloripes TaxID=1818881 RepID=A0A1E2UNM6_9GAMM|nr:phosphate ABC transporter permease PstA [Candidatus Thiodiazotropha endoloripes]MCG7903159.1 phosphate ABC transporter permease PstA [Candidatus Thiodiazotropha weberae]MCG7915121.1 phosphate ABC transporter permease PstA [Candidatus Thiodiazotropha weberae]ODB84523.1 phosphate ABC transporter, permease protein PstA [Candidatus Thiodiazotropha endoloripes]ODB91111.1 phosphate ABC transporter, permease protein PstA [Candidatus Thiodiazotropha endoloripes]ODB93253.1 phosphate ABC transporter,